MLIDLPRNVIGIGFGNVDARDFFNPFDEGVGVHLTEDRLAIWPVKDIDSCIIKAKDFRAILSHHNVILRQSYSDFK